MSSAGFTSELRRQLAIAEAVLADNQPFRGSMELFQNFVYLWQFQNETTFEYFERFKFYLDEFPNYGLPFHELINHFLHGMLPEERDELNYMAGGSVMQCTPRDVWCLIKERAESKRPYVEENSRIELEVTMDELRKLMDRIENERALTEEKHEFTCALPEFSCEESFSLEVGGNVEEIRTPETMSLPMDKEKIQETKRLVQTFPKLIINHLDIFGQEKEKATEAQGKSSRRRKRKRKKKKKTGVVARVSTLWINKAEKKNTTTVKKFDLDQPWDPNL